MKFGAYAGVSFFITLAAVLHAWHTRVYYYPTVVFMTTNKLAMAVLGNWAFVMTLATGKLMRTIFLGPLRDIEVEVMYENARYAITETCLALTVFRGDLTAVTIALFTQLLFIKAFHWLAQARVEHLEQVGGQSLTSMARLSSLVFLDLVADGFMVTYCLGRMSWEHPTVLVLFAFEYAILSITAMSTFVGLILHVVDSRMTGAWHGKATWTMLLQFISEVFRFAFYVIFFTVMFTLYSVPPLHLVRDIYMSFDRLQRRLRAFYRYQQLAATMDQRFPAATEAELDACERTCIICRDTMDAGKKLPCSHIFHFQCLRLWLQQQQACPTCRAIIPSHGTVVAGAAAGARAAAAAAAVGGGQPAAVGGGGEAPVAVPPLAAGNAGGNPIGGAGQAPANGGSTEGGLGVPRAADGMSTSGLGGGGRGAGPVGAAGAGGFGPIGGGAGFAELLGGGGGGAARSALPAGSVLHAVVVAAPAGISVRKSPEPASATVRAEPAGAVLLLMGPATPCGSFCVYGGWVGGPGRQGDVRLVDIAQPSLQNASLPPRQADGTARFPGMPAVPPGVGPVGGPQAELEEKAGDAADMLDGPDAQGAGDDVPGREGLRQRVLAGAGGQQ